MKQELQDQLLREYSGAFVEGCALTVGDGWYDLIRCIAHDVHTKREGGTDVIITAAYQKLGYLCIRVGGGGDYESGLTTSALYFSQLICEQCGDRGKLRNYEGELLTRCEKHFLEFAQNHDKRKRGN